MFYTIVYTTTKVTLSFSMLHAATLKVAWPGMRPLLIHQHAVLVPCLYTNAAGSASFNSDHAHSDLAYTIINMCSSASFLIIHTETFMYVYSCHYQIKDTIFLLYTNMLQFSYCESPQTSL